MNNTLYIFLFFLLYNTQNIKVISYNIRYNNPNDGVNIWDNRKSTVTEFISNEEADFVGMQEVLNSQLTDLMGSLIEMMEKIKESIAQFYLIKINIKF